MLCGIHAAPNVRSFGFHQPKEKGKPRGFRPVMLAQHPATDSRKNAGATVLRQGIRAARIAKGIAMLKADEFDLLTVWSQGACDQYAHMESAIDAGLRQKGEFVMKVLKDDYSAVVRLIVHRYRNAGWSVWNGDPASDGSSTIVFKHPHLLQPK